MQKGNLFLNIPETFPEEIFQTLVSGTSFRLERILSDGQSTPAGEWYDQATAEWVILLQGAAGLLFEGDDEVLQLVPGDCVLIPAQKKHRVEWTAKNQKTVWLALHYE